MPYTAERYHDFSAGHRVYGHESKCAHLHGHNYRVHFVCVPAEDLDSVGRVVDFSVIKNKLCNWLEECWDHKTLIWIKDPLLKDLQLIDPQGVLPVPFNPTAENMAQFLVDVAGPTLLKGTGVVLAQCRVEETRRCTATYTADQYNLNVQKNKERS